MLRWVEEIGYTSKYCLTAQSQVIKEQLEGKFELATAFIFNLLNEPMSNPAPLSRQEMLGSSGKCLHNFYIIYSRYLASATGNDFSIRKCVTECPRQEINLRSLSGESDPGPLNAPDPSLHRNCSCWHCHLDPLAGAHSAPLIPQCRFRQVF